MYKDINGNEYPKHELTKGEINSILGILEWFRFHERHTLFSQKWEIDEINVHMQFLCNMIGNKNIAKKYLCGDWNREILPPDWSSYNAHKEYFSREEVEEDKWK